MGISICLYVSKGLHLKFLKNRILFSCTSKNLCNHKLRTTTHRSKNKIDGFGRLRASLISYFCIRSKIRGKYFFEKVILEPGNVGTIICKHQIADVSQSCSSAKRYLSTWSRISFRNVRRVS
ncbi:hypothetical protein Tcan_00170 [Toxocara canis]|uniref:Uncharacterized protein n=1 Tax=Toxocara canis TaxID=6265 RepID=A0A0B2UUN0_TOXCA|nr:hypothetical protein Tcan_00170 [Toxocara canis]